MQRGFEDVFILAEREYGYKQQIICMQLMQNPISIINEVV